MIEYMVRLLYGQRALDQVIPNFQELQADPRAALARSAVRIGAMSLYRIAIAWVIIGAVLPWLFTGELALGTALTGAGIGGGLFGLLLLVSPWRRTMEMVMSEDGLALRYGRDEIYCPWALFNVEGNPFHEIPDKLVLPVLVAAIPFVELRRDGAAISHGAEVKSNPIEFVSGGKALLRAHYEARAPELGDLLLYLGHRLGQALPKGPAPSIHAREEIIKPQAGIVDEDGWITIDLARIPFPASCCDCGQATGGWVEVEHRPDSAKSWAFLAFTITNRNGPISSFRSVRYASPGFANAGGGTPALGLESGLAPVCCSDCCWGWPWRRMRSASGLPYCSWVRSVASVALGSAGSKGGVNPSRLRATPRSIEP